MRKYLKNKNEYIEDGNHYVEKIRKCSVWKKIGDAYLLQCKIIQRGTNIYTYDNSDYLTFFPEKKRWLSEEAKQTVVEAVEGFEQMVKEIKEGEYTLIPIEEMAMTVYLKRQDRYGFHFMLEYYDENEGEQLITFIFNASSIGEVIREIRFCRRIEKLSEIYNLLSYPSRESIHQNPIYQAAVRTDDLLLQHEIKLYYRIADSEECAWLSDYYGVRILPSLSKEYDRDYVVDRDSVDGVLLENSGYEITHRPYFGMKGYTHTKYTLNPHTKTGMDAARCDETSISFQEYLKLCRF